MYPRRITESEQEKKKSQSDVTESSWVSFTSSDLGFCIGHRTNK